MSTADVLILHLVIYPLYRYSFSVFPFHLPSLQTNVSGPTIFSQSLSETYLCLTFLCSVPAVSVLLIIFEPFNRTKPTIANKTIHKNDNEHHRCMFTQRWRQGVLVCPIKSRSRTFLSNCFISSSLATTVLNACFPAFILILFTCTYIAVRQHMGRASRGSTLALRNDPSIFRSKICGGHCWILP